MFSWVVVSLHMGEIKDANNIIYNTFLLQLWFIIARTAFKYLCRQPLSVVHLHYQNQNLLYSELNHGWTSIKPPWRKKKNIQEQCCSGGKILYLCLTHSEVVEGGVWQTTSCYVFGQLVQHLWVLGLKRQQRRDFKSQTHKDIIVYIRELHVVSRCTHMHGQYTAGDEFTVLSDAEVPRLYPHHVVKHELQVQAPFYTHLQQFRWLRSVHSSWTQYRDGYKLHLCPEMYSKHYMCTVRVVHRLVTLLKTFKLSNSLQPSSLRFRFRLYSIETLQGGVHPSLLKGGKLCCDNSSISCSKEQ